MFAKPVRQCRRRKPLGWKRRKAMAESTAGPMERSQIAAAFGGRCGYCRERSAQHWDHRVPIAKGGKDEPANLVPACAKCNYKKGQAVWPMPEGHPYAA